MPLSCKVCSLARQSRLPLSCKRRNGQSRNRVVCLRVNESVCFCGCQPICPHVCLFARARYITIVMHVPTDMTISIPVSILAWAVSDTYVCPYPSIPHHSTHHPHHYHPLHLLEGMAIQPWLGKWVRRGNAITSLDHTRHMCVPIAVECNTTSAIIIISSQYYML